MKRLLLVPLSLFTMNTHLIGLTSPSLNGDRLAHVAELRAASFSADDAAGAMVDALEATPGVSVSTSYTGYESDTESARPYEGDADLYRGTLAYTHSVSDFRLGLGISYIEQELDYKSTDGSGGSLDTDVEGFILTAGGTTQLAKIDLSLIGGWGQLDADSVLSNGNLDTNQETELYFVEASAVYHWIEDETFSILPSLALGYQYIRMDSFTELAGPGLGNFEETEYDELTMKLPYVEAGLTAQYLGLDQFTPYAQILVWKHFGNNDVDFSARQVPDAGTDATFQQNFDVPVSVEVLFTYLIGGEYRLSEDFGVQAEASYFNGDDIDGYRLTLNGIYRF